MQCVYSSCYTRRPRCITWIPDTWELFVDLKGQGREKYLEREHLHSNTSRCNSFPRRCTDRHLFACVCFFPTSVSVTAANVGIIELRSDSPLEEHRGRAEGNNFTSNANITELDYTQHTRRYEIVHTAYSSMDSWYVSLKLTAWNEERHSLKCRYTGSKWTIRLICNLYRWVIYIGNRERRRWIIHKSIGGLMEF